MKIILALTNSLNLGTLSSIPCIAYSPMIIRKIKIKFSWFSVLNNTFITIQLLTLTFNLNNCKYKMNDYCNNFVSPALQGHAC